MSDIELRPSFHEYFRTFISERLPKLRNYIVSKKQLLYEAPYPSPLRVISDGFIFGIRVYCSLDSLKEIIKAFTSSRYVVLLEAQVYRLGEKFISIFVLVTDKEKNIWKIAGEIADLDGIEVVEVLKLRKSFSKVFINGFAYPPFINKEKASILPIDVLFNIISFLSEEQIKKIAKDIALHIHFPNKDKLEPDIIAQLLEALGLAYKTNVSVVNGDIIIKIKYLKNVKHCIFYKYFIEELSGRSLSLIKDEETCILNLTRSLK